MVVELNTASSFKRKSSCSLQDDFESGLSVGMERVASHDAKRRRTPMGKDVPFLQTPIRPDEVSLALCENLSRQRDPLYGHHQCAKQSPPQPYQFHSNLPDLTHNGQQFQLNTPPLDSPNIFQASCQLSYENGDLDVDDMMMDDDRQPEFITANATTTTTRFPQHHSHTAPPSPVTPSLVPVNSYDDTSNAIKWEGTKHKGYPRDAYEDPNANLWTVGKDLRKNMDGQVKGFKMGYLEGCDKCRARAGGHFGHFIMADSI